MEEIQARAKITVVKFLSVFLSVSTVLLLLSCGLITYGLWRAAKPRSLGELQAWVILITLALIYGLPTVAWAAFLFGRRDARVLTDGLAIGVEQVVRTADEVTEIKGKLTDRMRQPPVTVQVANLPAPSVTHRQLGSGGETVDL